MKFICSILTVISLCFNGFAQLQDGSIAPNFQVTDIDGNSHNLYDYLDEGKTVYLDFFAAHCPPCWNYKQSGAMNDLYAQYGPNGTIDNDVIIIAIELDPNNGHNELSGASGWTQGNWIEAMDYPIINIEGIERQNMMDAYSVNFYPLIYGICDDRTITRLGTVPTEQLVDFKDNCPQTTAGVPETTQEVQALFYSESKTLVFPESVISYSIVDFSGQVIILAELNEGSEKSVQITEVPQGPFIVRMQTLDGWTTQRFLNQ